MISKFPNFTVFKILNVGNSINRFRVISAERNSKNKAFWIYNLKNDSCNWRKFESAEMSKEKRQFPWSEHQ